MRKIFASLAIASLSLATCSTVSGAASTTTTIPPVTQAGIESAITAAASNNKVPGNLTPTLQQLSSPAGLYNAQGAAVGAKCDPLGNPAYVAKPTPCVLGATTSTKVVVMFGDSNAGNWLPAINYAMTKLGYKLLAFVYPGCSSQIPAPGTTPSPTPSASCKTYHSKLSAAIIAVHPLALISAQLGMDGGGANSAAWTTYGNGWKYTFDLLSNNNKSIKRYIMQTTPNMNGSTNMATCIGVHPTQVVTTCSPSYFPSANYQWNYQQYINRDLAAAPIAGATLISTYKWFCQYGQPGRNYCPSIVKSYLVYVDQDHISIAYMNYIAPVVTSALHAQGL